jgi:uncharacterized membrane protein
MAWLGTVFLYLHVAGVIIAFGPSIAFPFFAAKAAKEPQHGNFVLRTTVFVQSRLVEPAAVFVFLMGVGLIVTRGYNPLTELWLLVAIVLFIITFSYALLVQLPTVKRMIALTSGPPPPVVTGAERAGEAPAMGGPGTPAAPGAGPAGPPPEFLALATKAGRGGQFMTAMIFIILALMIFKPFAG